MGVPIPLDNLVRREGGLETERFTHFGFEIGRDVSVRPSRTRNLAHPHVLPCQIKTPTVAT